MSDLRFEKDESIDIDAMVNTVRASNGELKHGDIVHDDKGFGIVIEPEHERPKFFDDETQKKINNLIDGLNDPVKHVSGTVNLMDTDMTSSDVLKRMDPNSNSAFALRDVMTAFSNMVPGPKGLVPADSEQARQYEEKIRFLHEGKVILHMNETDKTKQIEIVDPHVKLTNPETEVVYTKETDEVTSTSHNTKNDVKQKINNYTNLFK